MEIRINLAVRGTRCTAELEQQFPITTGSRGVFRVVLHADTSWDAMDKTVVFRAGQISRSQHIGIDGTSCLVPPEVLAERAPYLEIGVYGTAGEDVVRTTTWARLHGIVPGAVPTGDAMESPDLYAQLLAQLNATVKTVNGHAPDEHGNVIVEGGGGGAGTPGGYYTPTVTQPDENTMRVSYAASQDGMADVPDVDVTLPKAKTAYAYAVEGGYTGTEAEFAEKLAEEMPTTLPNPNALTFTGAVTGSYDGSAPLEVAIPSGGGASGDYIPIPASAEVGQTIVVKAVDENGKPTEWEAADVGGWELITDITLTEDGGGATGIGVTRNDKGEDFEYRQCMVCLSGTVIDGWPSGASQYIYLYENNDATGSSASALLSRLSPGAGGTEYKTIVEMSIFGNLVRLIACGGAADTSSLIIRNNTSIDTFRSIRLSCYGNSQWVVTPFAAGGRVVIYGRK